MFNAVAVAHMNWWLKNGENDRLRMRQTLHGCPGLGLRNAKEMLSSCRALALVLLRPYKVKLVRRH